MFCNKCGEKLPDDAKFCTKCGYKVNNDPEMGSIVFKRLGQLYGSIAQIKIFLDGQMVASLGTNQEVKVTVPIGVHQVEFGYWCGNGQNTVTLTKENPNIRVNIKPNTIATTIPTEVKLNIPASKPKIPDSWAFASAPWIKECPKEVIGTDAPAPNHNKNLS